MALGPGKYDDALTAARKATGAGAALLVILDGANGPGFSCQAPIGAAYRLPALLRQIADSIERDLAAGKL